MWPNVRKRNKSFRSFGPAHKFAAGGVAHSAHQTAVYSLGPPSCGNNQLIQAMAAALQPRGAPWIQAFAYAEFDADRGQVMRFVYPPEAVSDQDQREDAKAARCLTNTALG